LELARRISDRVVCFDGTGKKYYFLIDPAIEPIIAPPTPKPVDPVSFKMPVDVDLSSVAGRRLFVQRARLLAYGECSEDTLQYWLSKADEMIARGYDLGEGLNYFWTRLIGRGAGGVDVAKFGPYAGLSEYQGPLV
jgi:hypothetical protein